MWNLAAEYWAELGVKYINPIPFPDKKSFRDAGGDTREIRGLRYTFWCLYEMSREQVFLVGAEV